MQEMHEFSTALGPCGGGLEKPKPGMSGIPCKPVAPHLPVERLLRSMMCRWLARQMIGLSGSRFGRARMAAFVGKCAELSMKRGLFTTIYQTQ